MSSGGRGPESGERRGPRRFAARIRVRFRSVEELITAYTADVSRGGLYVASGRQFEAGTWVKLSLELPDGGPPATVSARVSYALDATDALRLGREPGMGVQFSDPGGLADRIAAILGATLHDDSQGELRVLLVHAGPDRTRIASTLEAAGHHVTTARHGLDAFGRVIDEPPDVVLCEMHMPVLDGWQLVRLLRKRDGTRDVPVVFVAENPHERDRARAYDLGVEDIVDPRGDLSGALARAVARSEIGPAVPEEAMSGTLDQVSAISVLAFAEAERRSGLLILTTENAQATVGILDGVVVSVDLPGLGAPASLFERLLTILDLSSGRFVLRPGEPPVVTDDRASIQAALLEHARRLDERSR